MKRIAVAIIMVAALAGCGTTGGNQPGHRVGAVNNGMTLPCETGLALTNSTVTSAARITISVDTLSYVIVTGSGWSGTYSLQASNDNSTWFDVTLPSSPPASTGTAQTTPIEYDGGWPWAYGRIAFKGTSGSTTATVCQVIKG